MKKNSIILCIAAMIAVAFTSCETTPSFYSVKGVVPDSLNGKNVELYTCERKNKKIATTSVKIAITKVKRSKLELTFLTEISVGSINTAKKL